MAEPKKPTLGLGAASGAVLLIVTAAALFSLMNALAKIMGSNDVNGLNGVQLAFARYLFAAVWLGLVLRKPLASNLLPYVPKLAMRTTAGVMGVVCMFIAVQSAPLATTVMISSVYPVIAMIIAIVLLRESANWRHGVCALIGLAGTLAITMPQGSIRFDGYGWAIAAALFMALEIVAVKWISVLPIEATRIVFVVNLIGSTLLLPFIWTDGVEFSFRLLLMLTLLGGVAAAGQLLILRASKSLSGISMGPAFLSSIVFATLFGWVFFAEVPSTREIVGTVLIVIAALTIPWADHKKDI